MSPTLSRVGDAVEPTVAFEQELVDAHVVLVGFGGRRTPRRDRMLADRQERGLEPPLTRQHDDEPRQAAADRLVPGVFETVFVERPRSPADIRRVMPAPRRRVHRREPRGAVGAVAASGRDCALGIVGDGPAVGRQQRVDGVVPGERSRAPRRPMAASAAGSPSSRPAIAAAQSGRVVAGHQGAAHPVAHGHRQPTTAAATTGCRRPSLDGDQTERFWSSWAPRPDRRPGRGGQLIAGLRRQERHPVGDAQFGGQPDQPSGAASPLPDGPPATTTRTPGTRRPPAAARRGALSGWMRPTKATIGSSSVEPRARRRASVHLG